MNRDWSTYIQGIATLHTSRTLRFSDCFRERYTEAFAIPAGGRILEVGCGTGALLQALHRWYPAARLTGVDRDSAFVSFAREQCPDAEILEGDAQALTFPEGSFDVTISHTVSEHVDPARFFAEQYRVLRPGGICLVLSARRGIGVSAPCVAGETDFEQGIWQRVSARYDEMEKRVGMRQNPMDERQLPLCMEEHGFRNVSTGYLAVNLTPDEPYWPAAMARAMIGSERASALDALDSLEAIAPDLVSGEELRRMRALANGRYDERLALYEAGVKQWDASVSVTLVVRGEK